jgi:hypothetical protein
MRAGVRENRGPVDILLQGIQTVCTVNGGQFALGKTIIPHSIRYDHRIANPARHLTQITQFLVVSNAAASRMCLLLGQSG